jgi:magnesium-transporting ATPase (P-type)
LAAPVPKHPTAAVSEWKEAAYALPVSDVIERLGTDPDRGLTENVVGVLRTRVGPNELAEAPPELLWRKLLGQCNQPVIWILIVAAVIAGLLGEWPDALAILAIVLLNGLLGFFQEERAGRALASLRQMSAPLARVLRDGELRTVPARDLVPGDRVELDAGDHVPADARLVAALGLRIQEAAVTDESAPEDKDAQVVLAESTPHRVRREGFEHLRLSEQPERERVQRGHTHVLCGLVAELLVLGVYVDPQVQRRRAGEVHHPDVIGGHARSEQPAYPLHDGGRFAGAGAGNQADARVVGGGVLDGLGFGLLLVGDH